MGNYPKLLLFPSFVGYVPEDGDNEGLGQKAEETGQLQNQPKDAEDENSDHDQSQ